ncbi:MAG: TlpA disulfide reductase family protein [Desulfuromonas sp.]|nr:TlpA disulfide reductase family protein [Desulfuromonas sp.]
MKKIVIGLILCTIALLVAFVVVNKKDSSTSANTVQLDMGQALPMAPDFQLQDMNGQTVQLSALRGQVVVVNFWATWCPPCREEIPSMNRLKNLLADLPVAIVAVNVEADGPITVPRFVQRQPVEFTVAYDVDGVVHKQYGVAKFPETFIVNPDGVVVEIVIGGIDWSAPQVVDYLKQLLP